MASYTWIMVIIFVIVMAIAMAFLAPFINGLIGLENKQIAGGHVSERAAWNLNWNLMWFDFYLPILIGCLCIFLYVHFTEIAEAGG